jgi:hypothetical protein
MATFEEALKLFRALPRDENISIEECKDALEQCEHNWHFATPFARAKATHKGQDIAAIKTAWVEKAKKSKENKQKWKN